MHSASIAPKYPHEIPNHAKKQQKMENSCCRKRRITRSLQIEAFLPSLRPAARSCPVHVSQCAPLEHSSRLLFLHFPLSHIHFPYICYLCSVGLAALMNRPVKVLSTNELTLSNSLPNYVSAVFPTAEMEVRCAHFRY